MQPMVDELGFWAYRVDNAFPPDMHDRLITLMNQSFDPIKGVSEVMHSKNREVKSNFDYKVLNKCKHPCVCGDKYAGLSNHTIWQWGNPGSSTLELRRTWPAKPPAVVE